MLALVFPGQASQFEGMGKDLYESSELARTLFDEANQILGYKITEIMFDGSAEDLMQTKITQPAVFLHSIITARVKGANLVPIAVAGHSLGEFSGLVVAGALNFESGLRLVYERATSMQHACELAEGTMAAIVGLEDSVVEDICDGIDEVVVAANYNYPGQLVISGSKTGIALAIEKLSAAGAKRALEIPVGGAFHSPLMEPAREQLAKAIDSAEFMIPNCPVYQNVDAKPHRDPEQIKSNLKKQLTSSVRWTQLIRNMVDDGVSKFVEIGGNGKVLRGMIRRIDRSIEMEAI